MTKNVEIESKTLLDKNTYEKIRQAFVAKSDFIQENYYFDTPDFTLKNNNASLRIRLLVNNAEQTLKVKEDQPKQNNYHEVVEINDVLSLARAEQMVHAAADNEHFTFGGDAGNYVEEHFGKEAANTLQMFSWSKTRRMIINGPQNCDLTLDLTEFPDGYYDFELEIENEDPATIKKVLDELETQFDFKSTKENTNQNKVSRSFEHRIKK